MLHLLMNLNREALFYLVDQVICVQVAIAYIIIVMVARGCSM